MKKFNELKRNEKILTISLLLLIIAGFIFFIKEVTDSDNYETTITCRNNETIVVPGKVDNPGVYCESRYYVEENITPK